MIVQVRPISAVTLHGAGLRDGSGDCVAWQWGVSIIPAIETTGLFSLEGFVTRSIGLDAHVGILVRIG